MDALEIVFALIAATASLVGMIVTVITFTRAVNERHSKSAAEAAGLKADIRMVHNDIDELKADLKTANNGYHENDRRIVSLDGRVKRLEARIQQIEEEVHNSGRSRVPKREQP